jgi:uncharacterized damage-inducible protein DinB
MRRAAIAEARAFESWHDYQEALKRAIAPLTDAQLQRRLISGLRTPGEIAEHIVFGRALHLHRTLGEQAAELRQINRLAHPLVLFTLEQAARRPLLWHANPDIGPLRERSESGAQNPQRSTASPAP